MNECVILDFETLGQRPSTVVTSFALLSFTESRYVKNSYSFQELIKSVKYIKFDVEEQVNKYHRTLDPDTIKWWSEQSSTAKAQIKPRPDDVSIDKLYQFLIDNIDLACHKKMYSRGNTFDPIILDSILASCGKVNPMHWGSVRDTRSMIEGMSFGFPIKNDFIPDNITGFIKHNPIHDIALDVMRMQTLAKIILPVETILC
jgi:hypothetical protein